MLNKIAGRAIDEYQEFRSYVFGYDDTERISVEFHIGPDAVNWSVYIMEGGPEHVLADGITFGFRENGPPKPPNWKLAAKLLRLYWTGQWPGMLLVEPKKPKREETK